MKLSLQQLQTLKRLTKGPRSSLSFTTSESHLTRNSHSLTHLKFLEMHGYVVEIQDLWHMTNAGRLKLIAEKSEPSYRHSNGTQHENYVQGDWKTTVHRRGALDFLKYPSKFSVTPTC